MFKSSLSSLKHYFEKLEKQMQLINPARVSLISQIKTISLKNASGKMSDEKTRIALEQLLIKYDINPSAVRRNEQHAFSTGIAMPSLDYGGNGISDLIKQGSKPGVNLLAGVRTNRTKGMLEDFKVSSPSGNLVGDLTKKNNNSSKGMLGDLKVSSPKTNMLGDLGKKYKQPKNVNLMDIGKNVKQDSGLGLGNYVYKNKNNKKMINFDFGGKPQNDNVMGTFMNLAKAKKRSNKVSGGLLTDLLKGNKK